VFLRAWTGDIKPYDILRRCGPRSLEFPQSGVTGVLSCKYHLPWEI
jgi:hypothetical protein